MDPISYKLQGNYVNVSEQYSAPQLKQQLALNAIKEDETQREHLVRKLVLEMPTQPEYTTPKGRHSTFEIIM
jgi:hypothetical protein